jgi:hypothetical protein
VYVKKRGLLHPTKLAVLVNHYVVVFEILRPGQLDRSRIYHDENTSKILEDRILFGKRTAADPWRYKLSKFSKRAVTHLSYTAMARCTHLPGLRAAARADIMLKRLANNCRAYLC